MRTTPQLEIPTDVRKITETERGAGENGDYRLPPFRFSAPYPAMSWVASELSNKALGYAERNVASAFEFAQRLVQVRDVQALTKLQMDFIHAQMQAMTEQAKDLSETATKAADGQRENPDKGRSIVLIAADKHSDNSIR